jgi:uncharacterized membrane protein
MFCPSCGNENPPQSTFCTRCGSPLAAAPANPEAPFTPVTPISPAATAPLPVTGSSGLSENAAAAIAYLTVIPAIIFLLIEPYNKMRLVRFHSVQSIALGVTSIILQFGLTALQVSMHFIPLSWMFFSLLHLVIFLGLFVFWLIAILKASKGEFYRLPIIGDFAQKQVGT